MINIILFGPPGAGKGTQAEKLTKSYDLVHLSTGDIFRSNIKGETVLGELAKSYMEKGELVPDSVTIQMLEQEVKKHTDTNGFVFDGFPRTTNQAFALSEFLNSIDTEITIMLALEVPEEELINRLLSRGKNSGRADDQDENIIANRIKVYNNQTAIVADYYADQNKFVAIDGSGDIEEISIRIFNVIDKY